MKATRPQQKKFFVLCAELGIDKKKAEARAMKLYNLPDFADISIAQISPLIDAMQQKINTKQKESVKIANGIHARIYDRVTQRMLYSHTQRVGNNEGLIIYFPLSYAVEREVKEDSEIDVMIGSGKSDETKKEIYRYDIFLDYKKRKWLADIDADTLQWIAINMETDEKQPLYLFKYTKIVGSVYEEVKSE